MPSQSQQHQSEGRITGKSLLLKFLKLFARAEVQDLGFLQRVRLQAKRKKSVALKLYVGFQFSIFDFRFGGGFMCN